MRDILLITIECVREDYVDKCPVFESLDTATGIVTGTFTRPSLAALHSGQFQAAIEGAMPDGPSLATVLHRAGYDTAGFAYSPQVAPFGFEQGYGRFETVETDSIIARGSSLRERFGQSKLVRRLYRRRQSKNATLAKVPRDELVVDEALNAWSRMKSPRFLWVHLMGSHRPYGWEDDALPAGVGAKAANAESRNELTREQRDEITTHYCHGVKRVGSQAKRIVEEVGDVVTVVAGDHGEELGEHGYYFHAPYRQRTVDELVRVPVGIRELDIPDTVGLVDIPDLITSATGVSQPDEWESDSTRSWQLSAAPWNGTATVRLQDDVDLRLAGVKASDVSNVHESNFENQLKALGYI
jgi:hypothetical protein